MQPLVFRRFCTSAAKSKKAGSLGVISETDPVRKLKEIRKGVKAGMEARIAAHHKKVHLYIFCTEAAS